MNFISLPPEYNETDTYALYFIEYKRPVLDKKIIKYENDFLSYKTVKFLDPGYVGGDDRLYYWYVSEDPADDLLSIGEIYTESEKKALIDEHLSKIDSFIDQNDLCWNTHFFTNKLPEIDHTTKLSSLINKDVIEMFLDRDLLEWTRECLSRGESYPSSAHCGRMCIRNRSNYEDFLHWIFENFDEIEDLTDQRIMVIDTIEAIESDTVGELLDEFAKKIEDWIISYLERFEDCEQDLGTLEEDYSDFPGLKELVDEFREAIDELDSYWENLLDDGADDAFFVLLREVIDTLMLQSLLDQLDNGAFRLRYCKRKQKRFLTMSLRHLNEKYPFTFTPDIRKKIMSHYLE